MTPMVSDPQHFVTETNVFIVLDGSLGHIKYVKARFGVFKVISVVLKIQSKSTQLFTEC